MSTSGSQPNDSAARGGGAGPPEDALSRFLGAFSLALGVPQIAMPGAVNRMIGVQDDERSRAWQRAVGVREIAAGTGILSRRRPAPWLWARVGGDMMDLTLLGFALTAKRARPLRIAMAMCQVVGITTADVIAAIRMTRKRAKAAEEERAMHTRAAITVWKPREEVYRFWHDLEQLPRFMAHVESVEARPDGRTHWKAKAAGGRTIEWDAELVQDRPNELIAWRSVSDGQVESSGAVRFADAPGERGTEVHVEMDYALPGGAVGAAVAKLFGEEPSQQLRDDLRRFKQVMETGLVVRSEGSPEGPLARRMLRQRPAQPLPAGAEAGGSTS